MVLYNNAEVFRETDKAVLIVGADKDTQISSQSMRDSVRGTGSNIELKILKNAEHTFAKEYRSLDEIIQRRFSRKQSASSIDMTAPPHEQFMPVLIRWIKKMTQY